MGRANGAFVTLLLIAIAALGGFGWWQYRQAEAARDQLGLDAGRVLSAVFTMTSELRVATLKGEALSRSSNDGWVFNSAQETRAPYAVSYFVDLRKVDRSDWSWDADRKRMTVHIPDVAVERAAVELDKAQVKQDGIYISRGAGRVLNKQAAGFLVKAAMKTAKNDENMAKARRAAVSAVTNFVQQPLAAAGFDGITVDVRFPWEGEPTRERWDESKRPTDVLRDASK